MMLGDMQRIPVSALVFVLIVCCLAKAQSVSEKETVLSALVLSYGQPLKGESPVFVTADNYLLTPTFSTDGILVEVSIDPRFGLGNTPPLSRPAFEVVLTNLNSIKPLGTFEESDDGVFMSGGRAWINTRYEHGYLETKEPLLSEMPRPVSMASIYYLHQVSGKGRVPGDSRPKHVGSFNLVCFEGKAYIAPQDEFLKLQSKSGQQLTLELAGPTGDKAPGCEKSTRD